MFGDRITEQIKKLKTTARDTVNWLGVDYSWFISVKNNRRFPRYPHFKLICDYLGIGSSEEDFIFFKEMFDTKMSKDKKV